jgi:hypothetical protein
MGCDIHIIYEAKTKTGEFISLPRAVKEGQSEQSVPSLPREEGDLGYASWPFNWRWYGMFGFLAGVRNYSEVPRMPWWDRGLPADASEHAKNALGEDDYDIHSRSYIDIAELELFDYEQQFVNKRRAASPAESYRELLGPNFFKSIEICKNAGVERIVFGFDN